MPDSDVIVIGAGMAGINAAATAAGAGRRVTVIERDRVGGTCPIRGCIPSKALIRSAEIAHEARRAEEFGIRVGEVSVDYAAVIDRVQSIVERGSNGARTYLESLDGLRLVFGEARFDEPGVVRVDGELHRAPTIIVTTGAEAQRVPIPGLEAVGYLTSDDVLTRRELPRRLLVVGGGPVGLELGQALSRLGSEVVIVEALDRILAAGEPEISSGLAEHLRTEGIELLEGAEIVALEQHGAERRMRVRHAGSERTLVGDAVLLGVGRGPAVAALELDAAGVEHSPRGIPVDARLRTSRPGIWAAGDVLGAPYGQFTHVARRLGVEVAENALALDPHDVDTDTGPRALFTDPEVAVIGLTEEEARAAGHDVGVGIARPSGGKARAWGEERGIVKALVDRTTRRLLGAHVLAYHGADLLHPIVVAMRSPGGTVDPLLDAPHLHPTLGEVVKSAAASAAG